MKKIIISKNKEKVLFEHIINEDAQFMGNKEDLVKSFLNNYFKQGDVEHENGFGVFTNDSKDKVVVKLDSLKQPTDKTLSYEDLHDLLVYRFKNILTDKEERDKFLWDVLDSWYNNKKMRY